MSGKLSEGKYNAQSFNDSKNKEAMNMVFKGGVGKSVITFDYHYNPSVACNNGSTGLP